MATDPRLFCGVFSTGLCWADRSRERHGDYVKLAFLPFHSLVLEVEKDCPADLRKLIESEAADVQARRGEQYQVTTTGQCVTLGQRAGE